MCGIVGLFLKDPKLEPHLGEMLADMLITMTDRGPDSAGIAIYGRPHKGRAKLTVQSSNPEADFDGFDPMLVRSSYPESKRMAEAMCAGYAAELGVHAKVLRLTQTFGPGVAYDDGRVFASFARSAREGRDIVLHTAGETERSYLYTADAVSAILTVLLRGEDGQAYNAANEETYCSIRAMAELVARPCGPAPVAVRVRPDESNALAYAPTLKMDLDTTKLQGLGWRPRVGLEDAYHRMISMMAV